MAVTSSTRVGEFFTLGEFWDWRAQRLPPEDARIPLARLCCLILDPMRRKFGVTIVNSGFRTRASNTTVGGARESRHLYETFPATPAVDFHCATGTPADWARYANELMPHTGGIGTYRNHVHVDRRTTRARWTG